MAYLKEISGRGICLMELILIKFIGNPQSFYKNGSNGSTTGQTEKNRHSLTKKTFVCGDPNLVWARSRLKKLHYGKHGLFLMKQEEWLRGRSQEPRGRVKIHRGLFFQGAELCFNQVADNMCRADFTVAMLYLLCNSPLYLLNLSVYYSPILGLLRQGR